MNRAQKTLTALFVLAFFALTFILYRTNPGGHLIYEGYHHFIKHPPKAPAIVYRTLESDCKLINQLRYDSKRTGVAPSTVKPSAQVKILKQIKPLNIGVHDASKSSPIADDSGLYVGSDSGWFFKFDFDGNVLWKFYVPGASNGIHGSAAVDNKKVFFGAYNGFLYALDKSDGKLVWANAVGDYIGASPLLAKGSVFITAETNHPNGVLAKLDCNTGETLWNSPWLGGHSHSSPSWDEDSNSILVGANSGRFFALDADDGSLKWSEQFKGQIKGNPMIHQGVVYFSSWDKNYHAFNIKSGEKVWSTFMGGRIQTSLALVPNHNIGITNNKQGEIIGIDLKDGTILWRLLHGDPNHLFSVLISENPNQPGQYLAWSRCKGTQLCVLDAVSGQLLNHIELPGPFTSVPLAWDNRIYISLDESKGLLILE